MIHVLKKYFPYLLVVSIIISGVGTYSAIVHGGDPLSADEDRVLQWVLVNLVLLLAVVLLVSFKLTSIWLGRRRESVGSRLQLRLIKRFGLMTIIPTIIMAIFSALYFQIGIHAWFNDKVGTALNESVSVAEGYLAEHKKIISADILAMANDLNRQVEVLIKKPRAFNQIVSTQTALRSLSEAIVFQHNGKILARTAFSFSLGFEMENISEEDFERVSQGEVVVITGDNDDRVRALVKLTNFFDTYLLVGRLVDSNVLQHVELTKGSADEYQDLRNNISKIQVTFSVLFGAVALLLLMASMWLGMAVAGGIVQPVVALVRATEKVKGGDLTSRVEEGPENDEIGTLNRAFNRMTGQLEKQRGELIEVNRQVDERRRFIEAVLSGVSAGVIAIDRDKNITLLNKSAATLLGIDLDSAKDKDVTKLYPEISTLIKDAEEAEEKSAQGNVVLSVSKEKKASFHVKIVAEEFSDEIEGYIVTFDDITELQSAQKRAVWADVARRVAHEIKNPLTPIQLASERLASKFGKEIKDDKENFDKYIETIGRHVGDIRNMVEEFASFARMPAPVFEDRDIIKIINDTVFSRECANPDVGYVVDAPDHEVIVNCDRGQITQVLTNLIKNAGEAIEGKGEITVKVEEIKNRIKILIEDNGKGFPEDLLDSITEPYVTTREKGTGLGLAIVKKIVEDHGGKLELENIKNDDKLLGARVSLTFKKSS